MPTLDDILFIAFCLGGVLLIASVFLGKIGIGGQRVDTVGAGLGLRVVAGAVGIALIVPSSIYISAQPKPTAAGFCALVISGILAFVAVARGNLGAGAVTIDGGAASRIARHFSAVAALMIGAFGLYLLFRGKPVQAAPQSCPPGTRAEGTACVVANVIPTQTEPIPTPAGRPKPGWHYQTYIQIASERLEQDANDRAQREAEKAHRNVCVFESKRAFGIAFGPLSKAVAYDTLPTLKSEGTVPDDAFVAPVDDSQVRTCYSPPDAAAF